MFWLIKKVVEDLVDLETAVKVLVDLDSGLLIG